MVKGSRHCRNQLPYYTQATAVCQEKYFNFFRNLRAYCLWGEKTVRFWKLSFLFYLGGMCYSALELLWRGFTHWSMFLLGGLCFVLVGNLKGLRRPWLLIEAALLITILELFCGLLVNRNYRVWDYRRLPLNFKGQICLPFTLLWVPVSLVAMVLYKRADRGIDKVLGLGVK